MHEQGPQARGSSSSTGPEKQSLPIRSSCSRFIPILGKSVIPPVNLPSQSLIRNPSPLPPPPPESRWVEHDAEEILASTLECIAEVMKQTPGAEVKCVGITNQRETTVVWDPRTGKPLAGAIVWLDTRTRSTVEELVKEFGSRDHFRERCGLPFSTYFSAVKYRWLLDNNAAVQQAVKEGRALFGTVDSWLLWNLSGGTDGGKHITDISNASRTMLMNLETCQWDPEICRALRIPVETLPEIRSNSEV